MRFRLSISVLNLFFLCSGMSGADLSTDSATPKIKSGQETNVAAPDAPVLTKLLRDFLAGASRDDPAMHERFWADDLIYTSSSGRRLGKAEIMDEVRKEGPSKPADGETVFTAEDIRVQQYDKTAIIAFRLVGTITKDGKTERASYLNTGTFLKRNDQWRAVAWQATVLPPETKK